MKNILNLGVLPWFFICMSIFCLYLMRANVLVWGDQYGKGTTEESYRNISIGHLP